MGTLPCKFHALGKCTKEEGCSFSHDPAVLAAPCPWFLRGKCNETNCVFFHPPAEGDDDMQNNKELVDFEMDNAKLKELKKLRKQSRAHNTEHLNRRRSVSTSQINDYTGQIEGFHNGRRMTLFVPDQNPDDIDEDEERELRQTFSNISQRRASFASRKNSAIFNFDPQQLPQVQNAQNLSAKPLKSALRKNSVVELGADLPSLTFQQ